MKMINWPSGGKKKKEEATKPEHSLLSAETLEKVKSYEKPVEIVLESLSPSIEDGSIGAVVGIDGGGRQPAKMLSHMISKLYGARNFPPPTEGFFAVGQNDSGKIGNQTKEGAERLRTAITQMTRTLDPSKKVLIVDETIDSGRSVALVAKPFVDAGFQVEVVGIGAFYFDANERFLLSKETPLTDDERERIRVIQKETAEIRAKHSYAYDPEVQAATQREKDVIESILYHALPLHIGMRDEPERLRAGASRIPNVPYLPPHIVSPTVNAITEVLQGIGDGIVARYEAKKTQEKTAP